MNPHQLIQAETPTPDSFAPMLKASAGYISEMLLTLALALLVWLAIAAWLSPALIISIQSKTGNLPSRVLDLLKAAISLALHPAVIVLILLWLVFPWLYLKVALARAQSRALGIMLRSHGELLLELTLMRLGSAPAADQDHNGSQTQLPGRDTPPRRHPLDLSHATHWPGFVRRTSQQLARVLARSSRFKALIRHRELSDAASLRAQALRLASEEIAPTWVPFLLVMVAHIALASITWAHFK